MKYLPNISIEKSISKSLVYEEEIEEYATKHHREKGILEVCQRVN